MAASSHYQQPAVEADDLIDPDDGAPPNPATP